MRIQVGLGVWCLTYRPVNQEQVYELSRLLKQVFRMTLISHQHLQPATWSDSVCGSPLASSGTYLAGHVREQT